MTHSVNSADPAGRPGLLKKGRGFLWTLAVLVGAAAAMTWVGLGLGLYFDVERSTRLILVVVAALTTEVLFWTVAAALGVSVFEARKRLWRRITGRVTGRAG